LELSSEKMVAPTKETLKKTKSAERETTNEKMAAPTPDNGPIM